MKVDKNDAKYRFDFTLDGLDQSQNANDEKEEFEDGATEEDMQLE